MVRAPFNVLQNLADGLLVISVFWRSTMAWHTEVSLAPPGEETGTITDLLHAEDELVAAHLQEVFLSEDLGQVALTCERLVLEVLGSMVVGVFLQEGEE